MKILNGFELSMTGVGRATSLPMMPPQQSFLKLFDRSKPLVVDIPLFKLNLVKTRGYNR